MAGAGLRFILHDGNRVVDNRTLSKQFNGMRVLDVTKSLYKTETRNCAGLGEEITAIEGIRKDDNKKTGFQVYVAVMKDGEVIEVGLPCLDGDRKKFLNASNLRLKDLKAIAGHLPEDLEIAVVWRLDKDMTQDIVITENSMLRSVASTSNDFSLLDHKPTIGCGGGIGDDVELVADINEVSIYCGETEDPIRLSLVASASPPQAIRWDSFDGMLLPNAGAYAPQQCNPQVTEFTVRLSWQDCLSYYERQPLQLASQYSAAPPEKQTEGSPALCAQSPDFSAISPPAAEPIRDLPLPKNETTPKPVETPVIPLNKKEARLLEVIYSENPVRAVTPPVQAAAQGIPLPQPKSPTMIFAPRLPLGEAYAVLRPQRPLLGSPPPAAQISLPKSVPLQETPREEKKPPLQLRLQTTEPPVISRPRKRQKPNNKKTSIAPPKRTRKLMESETKKPKRVQHDKRRVQKTLPLPALQPPPAAKSKQRSLTAKDNTPKSQEILNKKSPPLRKRPPRRKVYFWKNQGRKFRMKKKSVE